MTAEPRPVEDLVPRDVEEIAALVRRVQALPTAAAELVAREFVEARLAVADRENAEMRGEVERLRELVRANANAVLTFERECNSARAQLAAAQAQLAEVRAVLFGVRRGTSGRKIIERDEEAEIVAALSAAPQPEPDLSERYFDALLTTTDDPDEKARIEAQRQKHRAQPEPPDSDEPARKMTTASEIREQDAWIRGERDEPARTPDLMAALRVSVEAAKKRRIAPKDES